ncbi:MAG: glycosyltransferase family 39 protein [Chloroflexi bacterium]|nr:glycosyltransferase family 39 protein [Chloroflexota bacterium]
MRRWRRYRLAAEGLLVFAVLAVSLEVFFSARAKLDSDEAEWIGTTRYFQTLFVEHDVSPASWPDEYWTRTQPMVVRYAIGGWLWLCGYDLYALDPTYDHTASLAANRRAGLGPSDALLADARVPMRLLAALAVTMLYLVVRILAGPIGGLVAATLAVGSPYLQEHLIRAKAESTLMFLLFAGLVAAVVGIRRSGQAAPRMGWSVGAGVLLGLAFGAKLTAVLILVAVALWGIWSALADWRHGWRWPAGALAAALLVFLASNPFLYPDPVGRTWLLFANRQEEMARQQMNVPSRAVYTFGRRVALVWDRSTLNDALGPSRLDTPVEAILAVVGAVWLAARALRRRPSADGFVLLWAVCLWCGVTAGLGFLLQHYFVPTAMTAQLLAGLAAGWSARAGWTLARRYWLAARPLLRASPPSSLP